MVGSVTASSAPDGSHRQLLIETAHEMLSCIYWKLRSRSTKKSSTRRYNGLLYLVSLKGVHRNGYNTDEEMVLPRRLLLFRGVIRESSSIMALGANLRSHQAYKFLDPHECRKRQKKNSRLLYICVNHSTTTTYIWILVANISYSVNSSHDNTGLCCTYLIS